MLRLPSMLSAEFSVSAFRCRAYRRATLLWTLLAALSPIGAPIIHSFDAQHIIVRSAAPHGHVVDAAGSFHERGCPHAPPPAPHDGSVCLTCRTLQHGKSSILGSVTGFSAALRAHPFFTNEERTATAWVDLSTSAPRAPPLFS
jgi:hypothetical protein